MWMNTILNTNYYIWVIHIKVFEVQNNSIGLGFGFECVYIYKIYLVL